MVSSVSNSGMPYFIPMLFADKAAAAAAAQPAAARGRKPADAQTGRGGAVGKQVCCMFVSMLVHVCLYSRANLHVETYLCSGLCGISNQ